MHLAALYLDVAVAFLCTVIYAMDVPFCLLRYIDDLASICSANLHHKLCVDQYFHHARITGIPQDSVGHARQIHETPAIT